MKEWPLLLFCVCGIKYTLALCKQSHTHLLYSYYRYTVILCTSIMSNEEEDDDDDDDDHHHHCISSCSNKIHKAPKKKTNILGNDFERCTHWHISNDNNNNKIACISHHHDCRHISDRTIIWPLLFTINWIYSTFSFHDKRPLCVCVCLYFEFKLKREREGKKFIKFSSPHMDFLIWFWNQPKSSAFVNLCVHSISDIYNIRFPSFYLFFFVHQSK